MTSLCGGTIDEAIPDCSTCTCYDDEYPEDCDGEPTPPAHPADSNSPGFEGIRTAPPSKE